MIYSRLADLVLVLHFAFLLFVIFGGLLVMRWRRLIWVHIPVLLWGALIEFAGIVCPLTPLENWLRRQAGGSGYSGDFIGHYITAVMYPDGLTRTAQVILGALLVLFNLAIYRWLRSRSRNERTAT